VKIILGLIQKELSKSQEANKNIFKEWCEGNLKHKIQTIEKISKTRKKDRINSKIFNDILELFDIKKYEESLVQIRESYADFKEFL